MSQWYAKTAAQTLAGLESGRSGLSPQEAQARLDKYGPNQLAGPAKKPLWARFLDQMRDPMILVLLAAAALSLVSSAGEDWVEAVIILVIVAVNACISISQEDSAEKALEALQKMSAPLAKVVRGGEQVRLETAFLVPGDVIVLEAGDLVPADARILECANLKADESAMTGESVPVDKQADAVLPEGTVLGDRSNMVISSTVITNGRALCVVTATGMDTEVGRIAGMLMGEEDTSTPLQRKLAEISKTLSFVCLAVCAVMFGVGLLYHRPLLEMLMAAVSLAVAAIPEGLPAIVTIVLALGVQRMVKHNAIVKKLPAVETLGCAGVICSDKTGTLTQNRMTVKQVWTPGDRHRREALTIGALCNDTVLSPSGKTTGDPTETAFVDAALADGLDKNILEQEMPRVFELPFDSERKLMSTVHPLNGKYRVMVKGSLPLSCSSFSLSRRIWSSWDRFSCSPVWLFLSAMLTSPLSLDLQQLILHRTGGGIHHHLVPGIFAQQGLAEGGVLRDGAVHGVGLLGAHDLIGDLLVKLLVQHGDGGAQADVVPLGLVLLDNHVIGQNLLQLAHTGVELALLVFGLVVFAVLAEVAEPPGHFNLLRHLVGPGGLEIVQFLLQLLQALGGKLILLGHE